MSSSQGRRDGISLGRVTGDSVLSRVAKTGVRGESVPWLGTGHPAQDTGYRKMESSGEIVLMLFTELIGASSYAQEHWWG